MPFGFQVTLYQGDAQGIIAAGRRIGWMAQQQNNILPGSEYIPGILCLFPVPRFDKSSLNRAKRRVARYGGTSEALRITIKEQAHTMALHPFLTQAIAIAVHYLRQAVCRRTVAQALQLRPQIQPGLRPAAQGCGKTAGHLTSARQGIRKFRIR